MGSQEEVRPERQREMGELRVGVWVRARLLRPNFLALG